ncbi:unnamed protein product [Somion occarium]|uniref:O-methyltransferase C-terminal domain-containing protein n=1 Tax=Somion occarium TaxID=3059160 RepID=A0ABP1DNU2_9APHY
MSSISQIESLQASLNAALDALRDEMKRLSLPELSSTNPHRHSMDEPGFVCSPRLYEARRLAIAALGEIKNIIQYPFEKVVQQSCAVYDTACLDILLKTGVIDQLADSSVINDGLDVHDLQKTLDLDPAKLTVVLRYLASQGWLQETKEGTFKLTRAALELSEGHGGRDWIYFSTMPPVAQSLLAQITHPEWKHSQRPDQCAFQLAHNTSLTTFAWMKQHPEKLGPWAKAIQAMGDAYHAPMLYDFPWKKFDSQTFIDCGGGLGNLSIALSEILPQSQFIVQDLDEVITKAQPNIANRAPIASQEGRITAEVVDLFAIQPRHGEGFVYLLRHVLHNWTNENCIKMLKNITEVATHSSTFIIIEVVSQPNSLSNATPTQGEIVTLDDLIGSDTYRAITPPPYIPTNFGASAKTSLGLGTHMMGLFNARERSLREWTEIVNSAGLKVVEVHSFRGMVSAIECKFA